jgi:hypothetical protein
VVFFADPYAISAACVLTTNEVVPGDSPPTSLGLDENHPLKLDLTTPQVRRVDERGMDAQAHKQPC